MCAPVLLVRLPPPGNAFTPERGGATVKRKKYKERLLWFERLEYCSSLALSVTDCIVGRSTTLRTVGRTLDSQAAAFVSRFVASNTTPYTCDRPPPKATGVCIERGCFSTRFTLASRPELESFKRIEKRVELA